MVSLAINLCSPVGNELIRMVAFPSGPLNHSSEFTWQTCSFKKWWLCFSNSKNEEATELQQTHTKQNKHEQSKSNTHKSNQAKQAPGCSNTREFLVADGTWTHSWLSAPLRFQRSWRPQNRSWLHQGSNIVGPTCHPTNGIFFNNAEETFSQSLWIHIKGKYIYI